jgi:hypothetical protein
VLDWWHIAMRFEHALQTARGLGAGAADTPLAEGTVRGLERAKWRLWHGRWMGCRRKLAALYRWTKRKHVREVAGIDRLQRHISELLGYLERNQDTLVHYAARRRCGEPISTAFVESAVNEIRDWCETGGQAAMAIGENKSLAGWNLCPYSEPNVPLYTAHRT